MLILDLKQKAFTVVHVRTYSVYVKMRRNERCCDTGQFINSVNKSAFIRRFVLPSRQRWVYRGLTCRVMWQQGQTRPRIGDAEAGEAEGWLCHSAGRWVFYLYPRVHFTFILFNNSIQQICEWAQTCECQRHFKKMPSPGLLNFPIFWFKFDLLSCRRSFYHSYQQHEPYQEKLCSFSLCFFFFLSVLCK